MGKEKDSVNYRDQYRQRTNMIKLAGHEILIVDDSEMNRAILSEILDSEFEITEACDGLEAVEVLRERKKDFSLVLLDIVMPELDGFGVLKAMNENGWIEDLPVIMISGETADNYIQKSYEMGATDYISRPFDAMTIRRRVMNTVMLYDKQRKLAALAADQIYEREKISSLMVNILSHIVEQRNGESGRHVLHINQMTEILARGLQNMTDRYSMTPEDIALLCTASSLHDIGKIGVPEEILNKPGRLTPEEFEIIKNHSMFGAKLLADIPDYQNEPLVKMAYEVCRWHHERYDGKGYPDGLKGDDIPITAQIVSIVDVYDALTSERVYKKAYSPMKAVRMIMDGECGCFNPVLLECLLRVKQEIMEGVLDGSRRRQIYDLQSIVAKMLQQGTAVSSKKTKKQEGRNEPWQ